MPALLERMKTAWDSTDRDGELNRVVEAMAAEGVTQQAIESALKALLLEVRAAGADDDTEEIINTVGDRLHGWCHEMWHIHARTDAITPPSANGHAAPADTPTAPADAS